MSVLVDTSVWVEYFRSGYNSEKLDFLIDENLIVTNNNKQIRSVYQLAANH